MKHLLTHPLIRGINLDDPGLIKIQQQIIQKKPFLRYVYQEWYQMIAASLPMGPGTVLEIGSGPGFLHKFIPDLVTSDIADGRDITLRLDGSRLPFKHNSLRAIVMTDVLHHVFEPRHFFLEASRSIRPGGAMVMVEPWTTLWSRFIYTFFHHEPFNPEAREWEISRNGPLPRANGALPWIIFIRDREKFRQEFPQWEIQTVQPIMPFCYLVSGGVSLRGLMPGWTYRFWRGMETILFPWIDKLAMFAFIRVGKIR